MWVIASLAGWILAVNWTMIFKQRNRALPRDPVPDHRDLYSAIANFDAAGARTAMAFLVEMALKDTEMSINPK
jgi:DNA-binding FadR family transcriptional regulator